MGGKIWGVGLELKEMVRQGEALRIKYGIVLGVVV